MPAMGGSSVYLKDSLGHVAFCVWLEAYRMRMSTLGAPISEPVLCLMGALVDLNASTFAIVAAPGPLYIQII